MGGQGAVPCVPLVVGTAVILCANPWLTYPRRVRCVVKVWGGGII